MLTTREEIFERVRTTMQELFEVEADRIQPETRLVEDLELDSIDAIDLAARIEELTRHRLPEDELRSLRTVEDVVTLIQTVVRASDAREGHEASAGRKT